MDGMITEKQKKCVRFIESVLPVKFDGGTDGHAAYEFIRLNLDAARRESARQEHAADRFVLGAIVQTPATVYDGTISFRDIPARTERNICMAPKSRRDSCLWGLTAGILSGGMCR